MTFVYRDLNSGQVIREETRRPDLDEWAYWQVTEEVSVPVSEPAVVVVPVPEQVLDTGLSDVELREVREQALQAIAAVTVERANTVESDAPTTTITLEKPHPQAKKAEWVAYALEHGITDAADMTVKEIKAALA